MRRNKSDNEEEDNKNMNDQNSDVQKVLQLIRDYIISGNLSIRAAFGLPDGFNDYYFEFHEFKTIIKEICGRKANYNQIENCTEFIFKGTLKLEEDKKKQDNLTKILDKNYKEKPHDEVISFKFFEQIIRKILKKAGYKPILKKRERDEELMIEYELPVEELGISISTDFDNFVKLYLQYNDLLDDDSQLELLFMPYFSKVLKRLKENVSKGVISNETDKSVVSFFKNLIQYIGESGNYSYLLKIFIFIIRFLNIKGE